MIFNSATIRIVSRCYIVLTLLAGCGGGGGSGDSGTGAKTTGGNTEQQEEIQQYNIATNISASVITTPTYQPHVESTYSLLIPQGWITTYSAADDSLLVTADTVANPDATSELIIMRLARPADFNATTAVTELEKVVADAGSVTLKLVSARALGAGILRTSEYTHSSGSRFLISFLVVPDPFNENVTYAIYSAKDSEYVSLNGSDLITIVAGSVRHNPEQAAVEVRNLTSNDMPSLGGSGLEQTDLDQYYRIIEHLLDRSLTDVEKVQLAYAWLEEASHMTADQLAQIVRINRTYFTSVEDKVSIAEGTTYSTYLRWLLKDFFLDISRRDPLSAGSPLLITLLSKQQYTVSRDGDAVRSPVTLAGLESMVYPDAVDVESMNLKKLYSSSLIQNMWTNVTMAVPSQAADMQTRLQNQYTLLPSQASKAIVITVTDTSSTLATLGNASIPSQVIDPLIARDYIMEQAADNSDLYTQQNATEGVPLALHFTPWGHVSGDKSVIENLPDSVLSSATLTVSDALPLYQIRADDGYRPFLFAEQMGVIGELTAADKNLAQLLEFVDFQLEIDDNFRFDLKLDFSNPDLAQAAEAYFDTTAVLRRTFDSETGGLPFWDYFSWTRDGSHLRGQLTLPTSVSTTLVASIQDSIIDRASAIVTEKMFQQVLFEGMFAQNFGNMLDHMSGTSIKSSVETFGSGTLHTSYFGVP